MNLYQISKEDRLRVHDFVMNRDELFEVGFFGDDFTGIKNTILFTIENLGWFKIPVVGFGRHPRDYLDFNNMILVTISGNPKVWFGNEDVFSESEYNSILNYVIRNKIILTKNFNLDISTSRMIELLIPNGDTDE